VLTDYMGEATRGDVALRDLPDVALHAEAMWGSSATSPPEHA